ncbi:hypothetical protein VNO80_19502 [Phaseolus coccineus]|uniref:STICHEL DnaA-N-like alpha-beta domain-containing protein n=1 Tax=Phaseolus coccineus TaxID=3886 RepID=A0AAN9MG89_PHACN
MPLPRYQALRDYDFHGLSNVDHEPSTQSISKLEFEFERRKLTKDDVRELIYRELMFSSHLTKSSAEKFKGQILQASEYVLGSSIAIEI